MEKNQSSISQPSSLPSIKQLFIESWETCVKSILNLFLINLGTIFFSILLLIIGGIIFFISGLGQEVINTFQTLSSQQNNLLNFWLFGKLSVWIILYSIFFMLVGMISSIVSVLTIFKYQEGLSLNTLLKQSFKYLIPSIVVGFLHCFIVFGGFWVFIVPGIIFSIFLWYAWYEVVISEKHGINALKNSVQIVHQHFGEIFVRAILPALIFLLVAWIIAFLQSKVPSLKFYLSIPSFLLNAVYGWFGFAYSITLYKQARKVTDFNRESSLTIFWITAIIGWLIFILIAIGSFGLFKKAFPGTFADIIKQELQKDNKTSENNILSYAPSSCGLSIPVPKTTDTNQEKTRRWMFEELPLTTDAFKILDKDVFPVKNVLGSFISYKDGPFLQSLVNIPLSDPGVKIYCVDNDKGLSLEEYRSLALTNKNFKVTAEKNVQWGEVELVPVWLEGKSDGQNIKEPAYLGTSKDESRLLYIVLWGTKKGDKFAKTIDSDQTLIIKNLKYRKAKGKVVDIKPSANQSGSTNNSNSSYSGPSCTKFTIREGEFASDKCYSQKDHDDLTYYIERFNSATFSYNGAIASMRITCSGSDFFKDSCDQDTKQKTQAEQDINNYRGIINGIIAKGK